MKFNNQKIIFILLCTCFLLGPFLVLASLQLEQTYPQLIPTQTVTTETSLPQLFRFYSFWAIIAAAVVSALTLIVSGLQYIAASGKPGAMGSARKRVVSAFLGLAILALSYLVLQIINPKFNLLAIKKVPIESGVILISQSGFEALKSIQSGAGAETGGQASVSLQKLIDSGQVRFILGDVKDATKTLGKLVRLDDKDGTRATFFSGSDYFDLKAVGFWGKRGLNTKVSFFSGKDFEGKKESFTAEGHLIGYGEKQGSIDLNIKMQKIQILVKPGGGEVEITIFPPLLIDYGNLKLNKFDTSVVEYTDPNYIEPQTNEVKPYIYNKDGKGNVSILHPPLSWRLEGVGPGVYLYAKNGDQRYLVNDQLDFSQSDFNFNNMAEKIEIKNPDSKTGEKHDFLAVLYEEPNFLGHARMFFEGKSISFPLVYLYDDFYFAYSSLVINWNADREKKLKPNGVFSYEDHTHTVGNVPFWNKDKPDENRVAVNKVDAYGGVSKVSSAMVFDLLPFPASGKMEDTGCKEVKLCNENYFNGYCISYTPKGATVKGTLNAFTLPMPWYQPITIPLAVHGTIQTDEGPREVTSKDEVTFANNVKSLEIDGQCLVVLFGGTPHELASVLEEQFRFPPPVGGARYWEDSSGPRIVEVFANSDNDLSDNDIGMCSGTGGEGLNIPESHSCAQAIAVFPLKGY